MSAPADLAVRLAFRMPGDIVGPAFVIRPEIYECDAPDSDRRVPVSCFDDPWRPAFVCGEPSDERRQQADR